MRVFVDADDQLRLDRRIERDVAERGRTRESVTRQWRETVQPMYERFVEPAQQHAHVTIDTGLPHEEVKVAYEELADRIQAMP